MTISTTATPILEPRRRLVQGGAALSALALLGACQRTPLTFNSIDITGAKYGASLQALHDPSGRSRSIEEFKDRVVAVFFGFTQCPDVCPTTLAKLKEVKNLLGPDGERFVVILVTIDPEQDQPAMLQAYVSAFDPAFIALRGDAAATRAVANDFKVFYEKVPTSPQTYTMNHTAATYLFDTLGRVRLYSRHEDTPAVIVDDVRKLLRT